MTHLKFNFEFKLALHIKLPCFKKVQLLGFEDTYPTYCHEFLDLIMKGNRTWLHSIAIVKFGCSILTPWGKLGWLLSIIPLAILPTMVKHKSTAHTVKVILVWKNDHIIFSSERNIGMVCTHMLYLYIWVGFCACVLMSVCVHVCVGERVWESDVFVRVW